MNKFYCLGDVTNVHGGKDLTIVARIRSSGLNYFRQLTPILKLDITVLIFFKVYAYLTDSHAHATASDVALDNCRSPVTQYILNIDASFICHCQL